MDNQKFAAQEAEHTQLDMIGRDIVNRVEVCVCVCVCVCTLYTCTCTCKSSGPLVVLHLCICNTRCPQVCTQPLELAFTVKYIHAHVCYQERTRTGG